MKGMILMELEENIKRLLSVDRFDDPYKLLSKMSDIHYGFWDDRYNRKFEKDSNDETYTIFNKKIRLLFPDEIEKYRFGSCADLALYQIAALRDFCPKMFYVDENFSRKGIAEKKFHLHVGTYFRYTDNFWYWFEYAWNGQKGIHGPYSVQKDLFEDVKKKFRNDESEDTVFFKDNLDFVRLLNYEKMTYSKVVYLGHEYLYQLYLPVNNNKESINSENWMRMKCFVVELFMEAEKKGEKF